MRCAPIVKQINNLRAVKRLFFLALERVMQYKQRPQKAATRGTLVLPSTAPGRISYALRRGGLRVFEALCILIDSSHKSMVKAPLNTGHPLTDTQIFVGEDPMDEMNKLESYLDDLEKCGAKIPRRANENSPHLKMISVKAGLAQRQLKEPRFSRRIALAVNTIGLEDTAAPHSRQQNTLDRNQALISKYLELLEAGGVKLPGRPRCGQEVFFRQVEEEAGLNKRTLTSRNSETQNPHRSLLREAVLHAASRLGVEIRVLPRPLNRPVPLFTYEYLLEKGTEERRQELIGKSNARQQLYNTKWAIKLFLKSLELVPSSHIGSEFVNDFAEAMGKAAESIKTSGARKRFRTEIR